MKQKRENLKVVFVHTPCPDLDDDRLEPPMGIMYLATLLKRRGIDCCVVDLSGFPESEWKKHLCVADVYAFSTYSVTYHTTLKIRDVALSINPDAITIAGGPHVSATPLESQKYFDIIVKGEAEKIFLEIIDSLQRGDDVSGMYVGEPVENLDELPFPDYSLIDMGSYNRIVEGLPSISIISSRGCPFDCKHCNSRIFTRGKLRFRSPGNVVEEIQTLQAQYGTTTFRFSDDLFTFSPKRIREMAQFIKPLDIRYRVFARSCSMTQEAADQLYDSGCRHVAIGIESMSEKMLRIIKPHISASMNRDALFHARNAGLKTRIYLVVGFPGETKETFEESLCAIQECPFDEFTVYPFIPYPGTAVWENPDGFGAFIDRDVSAYVQVGRARKTCFAVTTKDFTPDDVRMWRERMINELEKRTVWSGKARENK